MHALLILLAAVFGAATGPLLVRPVYRLSVVPGEPWREACPDGHPFAVRVRGWLGPGRCARCPAGGEPYGPPPWRLALVTAVCCAAVAFAVGGRPELVVWLLLIPALVAVTAVDVAVLRLPDPLTLPMAAVAAAGTGVAALLPGADGSWGRALLAGGGLCAAFFTLALISPAGMGLGDVKLALTLGVMLGWYGWDVLAVGVFAAFLLAALFALFLVLVRGAGRKTAFFMGPFLALGALGGVLVSGLPG